ncbi:MAG TPA: DUF4136 domain-containing protein [Bryobacteraceae bacterium]|jgi:hypothetical protein|nr:DUF4136 domain-containing protein [Bryobacteraceae bacterium]
MKKMVAVYALLGLIPCLLLAKVVTDYDHQADFSKYHSYSWIRVETQDPLWNSRIKNAINAQLVAKGWNEVPSGGDTDVAAYGSTHNVQSLQTWYNGFGGGWRYRGFGNTGMSTTTVQNIPVGRLMVDIFDGNSKQLIWRGNSSHTLEGNPEKNEKSMRKGVAEMFKKFPPKSKG